MTKLSSQGGTARRSVLVLSAATIAVVLAGCASDSGQGSADSLTFLAPASLDAEFAQALADAYEEANPETTITVETRPGGAEGENLIKTRLSTGEMSDLFIYNSGALLSTLNPSQTLADISGEEFVSTLGEDFVNSVTSDDAVFGAPWGSARAGGMIYSVALYDQLGLEIPETWEQFEKNNAAIAAAGATPVGQTYGDPVTAQIPVLADYGNIAAADPSWAEAYTANERKYADEPALHSWEKLAALTQPGIVNEDFANARYTDVIRQTAEGEIGHYPILSNYATTALQEGYPELGDGLGFFAIPTSVGDEAVLTLWMPLAVYMPASIDDSKRELASDFLSFIASPEACEIHAEVAAPAGPYLVEGCDVPESAFPLVSDIQAYYDEGRVSPALEYVSPLKGASLEQIAVEVGSGSRSALEGAELYDNDVLKQAQQLGLEGW